MTDAPPLPQGYVFSDSPVPAQELAALLNATPGYANDITAEDLINRDDRWRGYGSEWQGVSVRDNNDQLVGYGRLYTDGKLDELAVAEAHQHQGIGKAIVLYRLNLALAAGVTAHVSFLQPSNTLTAEFYNGLGIEIEN